MAFGMSSSITYTAIMVHSVFPKVVYNGTPLYVIPSVEIVIQGLARLRFWTEDRSVMCLGIIIDMSNSLV